MAMHDWHGDWVRLFPLLEILPEPPPDGNKNDDDSCASRRNRKEVVNLSNQDTEGYVQEQEGRTGEKYKQ